MSEFSDLFKNGLSSFFKNAKEGENGDEEEIDEEEGEEAQNRRSGGNEVEGNNESKHCLAKIKICF